MRIERLFWAGKAWTVSSLAGASFLLWTDRLTADQSRFLSRFCQHSFSHSHWLHRHFHKTSKYTENTFPFERLVHSVLVLVVCLPSKPTHTKNIIKSRGQYQKVVGQIWLLETKSEHFAMRYTLQCGTHSPFSCCSICELVSADTVRSDLHA